MVTKWCSVVFSMVAVLGAFLPIAVGGGVFAYLHHLGGVSHLLYVLPLLLLGIAVLNVYKELPHMRIWFVIIGGAGALLSAVITFAGMQHVNAFVGTVARFEQESRQFQENFNRGWNEMERGFKSGGEQISPSSQTPIAANEAKPPSARPGLGACFLISGFVVSAAMGALGRRKAVAAVAAILACVLLSGHPAEAGSRKQAKETKKDLKEAPQPFGLVFGKSSRADALKTLQEQGGRITSAGRRIIKDELSNPDVEGYFLSGVQLEGVHQTKVWFYRETLMGIDYILSVSFKTIFDQLREKYGAPASEGEGFGETHASWRFKDVVLSLDKSFIGDLMLSYRHTPLYGDAKQSDNRYYSQITKEKAKSQQGF